MKAIFESTAALENEDRKNGNRRKQNRRRQNLFQNSAQYQTEQNPFITLLELFPAAVILIGEDDLPVHCNGKADAVLRKPGGLVSKTGRLAGTSIQETKQLKELIHLSVQAGLRHEEHQGGAMVLGEPLTADPTHIMVSPIRGCNDERTPPAERVYAAVFITKPGEPRRSPLNALKTQFCLTSAEARLLGELANGKSLEDIALEFEISKNTARAQLRNLFDKTGATRQAQLVKLVLSSPAYLFGTN